MIQDPRTLAAQLLAGTRYAMPIEEAIAQVQARRQQLLTPTAQSVKTEPTFTEAAPFPVIDSPDAFAAAFWAAREKPAKSKTKPKAKPKMNKSEPPERLPERPALRVIPGGKGDNEA